MTIMSLFGKETRLELGIVRIIHRVCMFAFHVVRALDPSGGSLRHLRAV